jgi:hypothetical protein
MPHFGGARYYFYCSSQFVSHKIQEGMINQPVEGWMMQVLSCQQQ